MTLEVIGAGFGRTGTLSLKYALEQLGFDKCYHMLEVRNHPDHTRLWHDAHDGQLVDWQAIFEGYRATVDWPSCNLWSALAETFPEASIILTLRDADAWYDSIMNTIYLSSSLRAASDDPGEQASGQWAMDIIWNRIFGGKMDDRAHVTSVFNRHNEDVIKRVPAERLLVFEAKEGWAPLCGFLDRPIPETDYPRVNSTEDFRKIFPAGPAKTQ
jgi:hypothetical protein